MKIHVRLRWILAVIVAPFVVLGLVVLAVNAYGAVRFDPVYFADEYVEQYGTPGAAARTLEQALKTGDPQIFEYRLQVDKNSLDVESRIVVSGKDEVLVIVRDDTLRKSAEEALLKAHENLERRVDERTEALTKANQKLQGEIRQRELVEEDLRNAYRDLKSTQARDRQRPESRDVKRPETRQTKRPESRDVQRPQKREATRTQDRVASRQGSTAQKRDLGSRSSGRSGAFNVGSSGFDRAASSRGASSRSVSRSGGSRSGGSRGGLRR